MNLKQTTEHKLTAKYELQTKLTTNSITNFLNRNSKFSFVFPQYYNIQVRLLFSVALLTFTFYLVEFNAVKN